jgi:hypothetical protein
LKFILKELSAVKSQHKTGTAASLNEIAEIVEHVIDDPEENEGPGARHQGEECLAKNVCKQGSHR